MKLTKRIRWGTSCRGSWHCRRCSRRGGRWKASSFQSGRLRSPWLGWRGRLGWPGSKIYIWESFCWIIYFSHVLQLNIFFKWPGVPKQQHQSERPFFGLHPPGGFPSGWLPGSHKVVQRRWRCRWDQNIVGWHPGTRCPPTSDRQWPGQRITALLTLRWEERIDYPDPNLVVFSNAFSVVAMLKKN